MSYPDEYNYAEAAVTLANCKRCDAKGTFDTVKRAVITVPKRGRKPEHLYSVDPDYTFVGDNNHIKMTCSCAVSAIYFGKVPFKIERKQEMDDGTLSVFGKVPLPENNIDLNDVEGYRVSIHVQVKDEMINTKWIFTYYFTVDTKETKDDTNNNSGDGNNGNGNGNNNNSNNGNNNNNNKKQKTKSKKQKAKSKKVTQYKA